MACGRFQRLSRRACSCRLAVWTSTGKTYHRLPHSPGPARCHHRGRIAHVFQRPHEYGDIVNTCTEARKRPLIEVTDNRSWTGVDDVRCHVGTRWVEIPLKGSIASSEFNGTAVFRYKSGGYSDRRLPPRLETVGVSPAPVIGLPQNCGNRPSHGNLTYY